MAGYEVKCVRLDYDSPFEDCRAIEALGFEAVDGGFTLKTPTEVHRLVAETDDDVFVVYHGERTEVRPATDGERRYVRTDPEDTDDDALLMQPSC